MDKPSRRPGLPPELGVLAVVAAASLPLGRIFRDGAPGELDFGTMMVLTLATAGFVAWGLRRLRVPVLLAALLSGAGFLWFASALFQPGAMLGPFPSPRSIELLFATFDRGIGAVSTEVAPVAPTAGFLSLSALGIWATMWLADDAANRLRHPLLAIGLTLPIFAMPGTLLRGPRILVEVAFFCAAALLLLFQDERIRLSRWAGVAMKGLRPGLAARLATVSIVLAVVLAPLLPGYSQPPGGSIRSKTGGRVTINPLVSIKPTLDRFPALTLFEVRSEVATYWRLTSLDRFNGTVWTATPEAGRLSLSRGVRRSSPAPDSERLVQEFTVDSLAGPWVPAAYEPVGVRGIRGVFMQPVSRTLVSTENFSTGQRVTVVSELPNVTAEDLQTDDGPDPAGDRYLALPASLPPVIQQIAAQITSGAGTRLEKAIALQDYLRTFEYDLRIALRHNSFDLVRFLTTVRAGYCEQFAAAMAVMARSLGIPARVAIGFGGGEPIATDVYRVTSNNAHAWVEIHFPGHGWLAFEPTPRADGPSVPSYSRLSGPDATPTATPTAEPTAAPSPTGAATPRGEREENVPSSGGTGGGVPVAPRAGVGLLLALAVFIPGSALLQRTLRRRHARGTAGVEVRYLEFLQWCRAAALGRRPGETPREHALRIGARPKAVPRPVEELAMMATAAVYAPQGAAGDGPDGASAALKAAKSAVAASVPLGRRVLAMLGWGWWRNEGRPKAGVSVRGRGGEDA